MPLKIPRITGSFARFGFAYAWIGMVFILIGAVKTLGYMHLEDRVNSGQAFRGNVVKAISTDCAESYKRQPGARERIPCYRLGVDVYPEPAKAVYVEVMTEKDAVGELAAGDRVFLVAPPGGSRDYVVINERDVGKFFNRKYFSGAMILAGLILISIALLCKKPGRA